MTHWALIVFYLTAGHPRSVYRTGFATQAQCELVGRRAHAWKWYCGEVHK